MFRTVKELIELANKQNVQISEIMIQQEMDLKEKSREEIFAEMDKNLTVMEEAVEKSLQDVRSVTGLTGGDAVRLQKYIEENNTDRKSTRLNSSHVPISYSVFCLTKNN